MAWKGVVAGFVGASLVLTSVVLVLPPPEPARGDPEPQTDAELGIVGMERMLPVDARSFITLLPDAGGWGRLVFNATEPVTLNLRVAHDRITDLSLRTREGSGVYDESHFTVLRFFRETELPTEGYSFDWWGSPGSARSPEVSGVEAHARALDLATGERAVLLFATNVSGYSLSVVAQSGSTMQHLLVWHLGERWGFGRFQPEPTETRVAAAGGAILERHRIWLAAGQFPAILWKACAWTLMTGPYVRAGLAEDTLEVGRTEPGDGGPAHSPYLAYEPGNGLALSSRSGLLPQAGWVNFWRELRETGAESGERIEGAGFLAVPFQSLETDQGTY